MLFVAMKLLSCVLILGLLDVGRREGEQGILTRKLN
jgi:hypothetical protein